jgi:hypothetical protein
MKKIIIPIIIALIIIRCVASSNANSGKFNLVTNCDTISYIEFEKKVSMAIDDINGGKSCKIKDMIDLVRIYTTLQFSEYVSMGKKRNDFFSLFDTRLRPEIIDSFDCIPSSGVIMYSKKYKLYIGPSRYMSCNNYYTVKFPDSEQYIPRFPFKER